MAPNQFATMLHRKANKMSTILVYAVLEWFLIFFLLLNSLFSYIIRKFAKCFGLKPPCLLCSRVDHVLEPQNKTNTYGDLMCEAHATEISRLSYCPSHHKLTEFNKLCTNCLAFQHICNGKIIKLSPKVAVFTVVGEDIAKNDDENKKCSCCDEIISSCLLLKPSWGVLEHAQKTYLIAQVLQDRESKDEKCDISQPDIQEHCSKGSKVDEQPNVERFSLGEAIEEYVLRSNQYFQSDNIIKNTIQKYVNVKTIPEVSDNPTVGSQWSDVHVEDYVVKHDLGDNVVEQEITKLTDHSPEAEYTCRLFGDEIASQTSINKDLPNRGVSTPPLKFMQVNNSFIDNEEIKTIAELNASKVQSNQGPEELKNREVEEDECWDGSVMSEVESDVGASTIERLKSALKAEHNALRSLQAELEEERNAAAIAANQTMAMITRLQEEKSAMQMEALHYQRMMEEQCEYDQEALQILNDLVIKREKEKLELENGLEMYQKKVLDYEAKEKMMMKKSKSVRSKSSIASSSNMDDDDELFIDFIHEERVDDHCSKDNTGESVLEMEEDGRECMKHLSILDESIAHFEDERMSILEELKALEEKVLTLADDDEEIFEDRKLNDQDRDVYNHEVKESYKFSSEEFDGEGFLEKDNAMGCTAKRLLPLFDATSFESEGEMNEEDVKYESGGTEISLVNEHKVEKSNFSIKEEVDHVYRRLQALEADKEFLKHCFCSLKKGEKGREILEEILEQLCDLRTVEIQVRNRGNSPVLL